MTVVPAPSAARSDGTLTGTGFLARLAFRRSRIFWGVWILALWGTMVATVKAYDRLVPPGTDAKAMLDALGGNPTMRAMLGPPFDLLHPGGFTMWRVGTFVAAGAAMMAALGVIRATRAEEEDGRTELLRSGVVGRHAPLAAGLVVAFGGCAVLAGLITVSMGGATTPWAGALASGLGIGLVAAVWVGVGAVTAQLTTSARAARGMALGALGAAYAVRAVADGVSDTSPLQGLRWVSVLDWAALARPYAGERWWVLVLPLLLTLLLVALAVRFENSRDHGAGLRPDRPGPASGDAALSGPAGLAWRLHRPSSVGWLVGMGIFSLAIGTLSGSFDALLSENPQMAEMFRRMGGGAQSLRNAFYVAMLSIFIVVIALCGVQLLARLRREEEQGHAEVLLATAVSRSRFAASHLVPALVVPTVLTLLAGALLAVPQAVSSGSLGPVWSVTGAAAALLPGVWLSVAVGFALLGWAPRAFPLAWAVLGWSLFITWLGALLDLPERLMQLTPFAQLPQLPVDTMSWVPVLTETLLAALLVLVGFAGYRRRDVG